MSEFREFNSPSKDKLVEAMTIAFLTADRVPDDARSITGEQVQEIVKAEVLEQPVGEASPLAGEKLNPKNTRGLKNFLSILLRTHPAYSGPNSFEQRESKGK